MKLSKIYSNRQDGFHNIEFHKGLNVILAEIFDKSRMERDTHNLGKTLLISVIDFLLLKGIADKNTFFLTKGGFEGQVFFAEIQLNSGEYLIIKRSVDTPSKISFKRNKYSLDGFKTQLDWDETDLAFKDAKKKLNDILGFDILKSWSFRKPITYFLRTQHDFRDVFKLDKFKGKDKDWKPFMFDLLGFEGSVIREKYDLEEKKKELELKMGTLQHEADINIEEKDKIRGLLEIKTNEKKKIEEKIDRFNFYEKDTEINKELVETIDCAIQSLNTKRYGLSVEIRKIEHSLSANHGSINIDKLRSLYEEAKIYFPNQIVNDYEMLLDFNKSITAERNKVLQENLEKIKGEYDRVTDELKKLESKKEDLLSYLTEKDSYSKFKTTQKDFAQCEVDIIRLNEKLEAIDRASSLNDDVETIEKKIHAIRKETEILIGEQRHSEIRKIFHQIIGQILSTNALLSIKLNKIGNIEFEANIQNPIDLTVTAEDYGMTYRKLLCIAFDLSILINYSKRSFFRFVYHDGALEALDDRKRLIFLSVVREICNQYGLQYILTLIDSDLPKDKDGNIVNFPDKELCLRLHDRDDSGKLFMKSF